MRYREPKKLVFSGVLADPFVRYSSFLLGRLATSFHQRLMKASCGQRILRLSRCQCAQFSPGRDTSVAKTTRVPRRHPITRRLQAFPDRMALSSNPCPSGKNTPVPYERAFCYARRHAHTHAHIYTLTHARACAHLHTHARARALNYIHTRASAHARTRARTRAHTHTRARARARTHARPRPALSLNTRRLAL